MTTKVTRDRLFFAFEPKLQPALHIEQGENIRIISVRRSRNQEMELYVAGGTFATRTVTLF